MSIALPDFEKPEPTPQAPLYDVRAVIDRAIGRGKQDAETGLYLGTHGSLTGQVPVDMDIKALEPSYSEHRTTHRYAVAMTVPSRMFGMVRVGFEIASESKPAISWVLNGISNNNADFNGHFATNGYPSNSTSFVFVATGVNTREWDETDKPFTDYSIRPSAPERTVR